MRFAGYSCAIFLLLGAAEVHAQIASDPLSRETQRIAEPLGSSPTSSSEILVDGEEVVTGDWYAMAPGDQLLSTAAKAGKWINSVDPKDREAIEKSMDVVFGGPVKAVVGWTIEFGLEKAAKENPELVGELARLANEAGIWATDKISRDDEQTVRDNNAADKDDVAAGRTPATYIDNIFAAADLILGVDIPGVGRSKLPKDPIPTGDGGSVDHSGGLGGDGPYNSQQVQADLEAQYGRGNVQAGTLPPSNSRFPALAGTAQTVDNVTIVFDNRGFPIFDNIMRFETKVSMSPNNPAKDMRAATRDLRAAINEGKVDTSQFDSNQLAAIKRGDPQIPGLTWHHHQQSGRMQLIPTKIHSGVNHIGSVSLNKGP